MDVKKQEERNEIIRKKTLDLHDMRVTKCPADSPWIRPIRIQYLQNGMQKDWDVVRIHNGTQGPIDTEKYPLSLGLTLELCAGIVDKDKPLVEIARDELREECGYEAPAEAFQKIVTFRKVTTAISKQSVFYVEVTDEMHIHPGGGLESEGELIEVVEKSVPEVKEYMNSEEVRSSCSFLYGVTWFLANKPEYC